MEDDFWHLHPIDWLSSLSSQASEALRRESTLRSYAPGATIFAPTPEAHSVYILEKGLVRIDGLNGTGLGSRWEDVTEFPELGTTEVWSFVNRSGMAHPMHMHLVFFQVLEREAFDEVGGMIVPSGVKVPPPAHEMGWKDTVQVGPGEIVRVIARFENYSGHFPYHCHILDHEDHEMMRQFETVATVPACQDGLDNDGDGLTDYPADPACWGPAAPDEGPECDDGADNDLDGGTDWDGSPSDADCTVAWHDDESVIYVPEPSRLLGVGLSVQMLAWLARLRRRRG